MNYEAVIGIETHVELKTRSKMFCGCSAEFGAEPNTHTCPVCLGLPGALPVPNEQAIEWIVAIGLALDSTIAPWSVFHRKNYFYADMPKNYQISQFDIPICSDGHLDVVAEGEAARIGVTRVHMEEDTGKSTHVGGDGRIQSADYTLLDFNRAGVPLVEIVSEPDMRSAKEAVAYMRKIHSLVRYLEICDGNMQEGSFRCDANVSVRPMGQEELGTRTELKNINSFRFVEKAINFEIERQIDVLEGGGKIVQETRLYDSDRDETRSMRSKEEANDYRYFPDPDLLPLELDEAFIERLRAALPELPDDKRRRFVAEYGLSPYDAGVLVAERGTADYFEEVAKGHDPKLAANWVISNLFAAMNKLVLGIAEGPVSAGSLGAWLSLITHNTISGRLAKEVFEIMLEGGGEAAGIVEEKGLKQITDRGEIEAVIERVMTENPDKVEDIRGGKEKLLGWFTGQVMKETHGKANPQAVNGILRKKILG